MSSVAGITSRDLIYRELRRSIIVGKRKPGERLELRELIQTYGTSITPARDALQMLSQEGLVTIKPRSGYFVTVITLKKLRDMLELREILEVASVKAAALRITEAQLRQLEEAYTGYTGEDDESYDRYIEENRSFHYLIARASGNQELADMLGGLLDRLVRFMILCRFGATMEARHNKLIDVLRHHDVSAARQAMLDDVNETRDSVLECVIREEGTLWPLGTHAPERSA